jgi:hypothetical protein
MLLRFKLIRMCGEQWRVLIRLDVLLVSRRVFDREGFLVWLGYQGIGVAHGRGFLPVVVLTIIVRCAHSRD